MSYDIELTNPVNNEVLHLDAPHQMRGGRYAIGGTQEAHLNITWNYAKYYYEHIDRAQGIRAIYGMTGAQSIPILEKGISALGNDVDPDYWKATEGNAKAALIQLKTLAEMRPDGVWRGD